MDTYFAPAGKADKCRLDEQIDTVSHSPVMSGVLHLTSGLLLVLNHQRQIVAINNTFMEFLGIENPESTLGLRPGEALGCIYVQDSPSGCGTSKMCASCGAAVAIVSSLENGQPAERTCTLQANRNGKLVELILQVQSHPVVLDEQQYVLVFIHDITLHYERSCMARAFFHDINNMLQVLISASELLQDETTSPYAETILNTSLKLHKEIAIQRALMKDEGYCYQPVWEMINTGKIASDLADIFKQHPITDSKELVINPDIPDITFKSDISLLTRILCNLIINALEATDTGGSSRLTIKQQETNLVFEVWNAQKIDDTVIDRVFHRNYSTKEGSGRGIGTYSVKLFGETVLGGKVDFRTSEEGTTFWLTIPLEV